MIEHVVVRLFDPARLAAGLAVVGQVAHADTEADRIGNDQRLDPGGSGGVLVVQGDGGGLLFDEGVGAQIDPALAILLLVYAHGGAAAGVLDDEACALRAVGPGVVVDPDRVLAALGQAGRERGGGGALVGADQGIAVAAAIAESGVGALGPGASLAVAGVALVDDDADGLAVGRARGQYSRPGPFKLRPQPVHDDFARVLVFV